MQSYQDLINEAKPMITYPFGIMDEDGTILAYTDRTKIGKSVAQKTVERLRCSNTDSIAIDGRLYAKQSHAKRPIYPFIDDVSKQAESLFRLFCMTVEYYAQFRLTRMDRAAFYRILLMEELDKREITDKARELHITDEARRVVFFISVPDVQKRACLSVLKNLLPDRAYHTIFDSDEMHYILIRTFRGAENMKSVLELANMIADTVSSELIADVRVAVGTEANTLYELRQSYQNAKTAELVGNIFERHKRVVDYQNLGIGRLIYKLPVESCRVFLDEVFPKNAHESFDDELFKTAEALFSSNFNISKAADALYVHRNSVLYRISKIIKITGLDVRNFDDALLFKIAMLISKYLDYKDQLKETTSVEMSRNP